MSDLNGDKWRKKCLVDQNRMKSMYWRRLVKGLEEQDENVVSLPKQKPTQFKPHKPTQLEQTETPKPKSSQKKPKNQNPAESPFVIPEKPKGRPTQLKEPKETQPKPQGKRTQLNPEGPKTDPFKPPEKPPKYEDKPTFGINYVEGENEYYVVGEGEWVGPHWYDSREEAQRVVEEFTRMESNLLGLVVNESPDELESMMDEIQDVGESMERAINAGLVKKIGKKFILTPHGLFKSKILEPIVRQDKTASDLYEAMKNGEDVGFALHDALLEMGYPKEANLVWQAYREGIKYKAVPDPKHEGGYAVVDRETNEILNDNLSKEDAGYVVVGQNYGNPYNINRIPLDAYHDRGEKLPNGGIFVGSHPNGSEYVAYKPEDFDTLVNVFERDLKKYNEEKEKLKL